MSLLLDNIVVVVGWGGLIPFLIKYVSAATKHYCDFGLCDDNDEYCCDENQCCSTAIDLYYFWLGALLVGLVVACLALYKYIRRRRHLHHYQLLSVNPLITTTDAF